MPISKASRRTTLWQRWREYDEKLCDMYGDIWHHVTCMETFTTVWYAWRHWQPCDMHGEIDRHFWKFMLWKFVSWKFWKFASPHTRFESLCCEKCVSWKFASRHTHTFWKFMLWKFVSWKFASPHTHFVWSLRVGSLQVGSFSFGSLHIGSSPLHSTPAKLCKVVWSCAKLYEVVWSLRVGSLPVGSLCFGSLFHRTHTFWKFMLWKFVSWKFASPHTHVLKVCVMKICLETLTAM